MERIRTEIASIALFDNKAAAPFDAHPPSSTSTLHHNFNVEVDITPVRYSRSFTSLVDVCSRLPHTHVNAFSNTFTLVHASALSTHSTRRLCRSISDLLMSPRLRYDSSQLCAPPSTLFTPSIIVARCITRLYCSINRCWCQVRAP